MMHSSRTDQKKRVKLDSRITVVRWTRTVAPSGAVAGLQIQTLFLSQGSRVTIELVDGKGTSFGVFSHRMYENGLRAQVRVPAETQQELIAKVSLPDHGLGTESPALMIPPPVRITNVKWNKSDVRRGDVLTLSADINGVPDGVEAEIEIWEHDNDGAHDFISRFPVVVDKRKIQAEWEFEYHDDTDDIPTHDELKPVGAQYSPPEYFFRVIIAGVRAESGLVRFSDWIAIELTGPLTKHQTSVQYSLELADGSRREGTASTDKPLRLDDLPPGPVKIKLPELEKGGDSE